MGSLFSQAWEVLVPSKPERDPAFRQEIERLSVIAMRVVGGTCIGFSLLVIIVNLLGLPYPHENVQLNYGPPTLVLLGTLVVAASFTSFAGRQGRKIAWLCGFLVVGVLSILNAGASVRHAEAVRLTQLDVLSVLIVAVGVVPLRPWEVLLLGLADMVLAVTVMSWAFRSGHLVADGTPTGVAFLGLPIFMFTLLCTALSATNYWRLWSGHQAQRRALQAVEDLRQAESRAAVAESAVSMTRLAAALSHELNTPVGSLHSSVGSLRVIVGRWMNATPERQVVLRPLLEDLCRTAEDATERLRTVVRRIQRFTNLDRAEVQSVCLNELVEDVRALMEPELDGRVRIRTELRKVPRFVGKPQPLSAAISSLMQWVAERAEQGGEMRVTTEYADDQVQVMIESDGSCPSDQTILGLFELRFQVAGNRISAGNWSLFQAKQVVQEQGGEVAVLCASERATQVRVSLPVATVGAAATASPMRGA